MNFNLSTKALNIQPSLTLDISAKAKSMKAKGIDVISLVQESLTLIPLSIFKKKESRLLKKV